MVFFRTIFGPLDTDFCHLTSNIWKTVSCSVTCQLLLKYQLDGSFLKCILYTGRCRWLSSGFPQTANTLNFYRALAHWQHTDARHRCSNSVRLSVCLSVCPSVRDVPGLDQKRLNILSYFFSPYGSPIILVLSASNIITKFQRGHSVRGR